jgi:hypothetical protein
MVGIRGEWYLQSENWRKEVNASFRPKAGKNFLEKTRSFRENLISERLRELKKRSSVQTDNADS